MVGKMIEMGESITNDFVFLRIEDAGDEGGSEDMYINQMERDGNTLVILTDSDMK